MEPPPLPPTTAASPLPPIAPSKIRFMCSYGGHIVPRPHDKSLFYAGGETRIVALDRRSTASSLSTLTAHLSRSLFNNRPFHLKYQLPNEDLDSLISVVTDEDLSNMLDEHDRVAPPARIRFFLFPVKPESLGSALLDPKSESWFCDALKSTTILQKGQSADSGLLMGFEPVLEAQAESGGNSGSGAGAESRPGAESVVLETSSSFGSTSSSFSMSNSQSVGIGAGESETPICNSVFGFLPNTAELLSYPLPHQPDGKQLQHETQLIQRGVQFIPQYNPNPGPVSPYYPVYQMPIYQQHLPCPPNQPYPIYLVPLRPTNYQTMPMQSNFIDTNSTGSSSRPPLHLQSAPITPLTAHKEVSGAQSVVESAAKVYHSTPAITPVVSVPSNQGQLGNGLSEPHISYEPETTASVACADQSDVFDEDIAYNQIYKTQPSPLVLPSQYQTITKGTTVMLSEPTNQLQLNHAKQQAALQPL